ncbi:hypothetical protein FACS1894137_17180 [Spirochaetia bacterium]|nr:hypothetical protein FACS1894137_17180 [Spirochaetia bacterium]
MAFCSNCGTKLDEGAKFCPSCGTPAAGAGAQAPAAPAAPAAAAPAAQTPSAPASSAFASPSTYDDFTLKMIASEMKTRINMLKNKVGSPLPVASVIAGINKDDKLEGLPVDVGSAPVNQIIANMAKSAGWTSSETLEERLGIKVTKADMAAALDKLDEVAANYMEKGFIDGTVSSVAPGFGSAPAAPAAAPAAPATATAPAPAAPAPSAGSDLLGSLGDLANIGKAVDQLKSPFKGLFGKK